MESFPDGEWESMLCGQYPFSHFCSYVEADMSIAEDWFCPLDGLNNSLHYIFDESSGSTYLNDIPITESNDKATDIGMASENASSASPFYNLLVEEPDRINEGNDGQGAATIANFDTPKQKKRPRASRDIQKSPKKGSKKLKSNARDEEESNGGQSSSNCSSEDDIGTALRVKARASRGSATDPQSIYARKRREKINERLRILQKLVPNGTKVDISTMLEEAVQYVKLLQLQIKVLTSDSTSIFAYNGMNIGLYGNMSQ